MSIDSLHGIQLAPSNPPAEIPVMDLQDMKRLLMLGIRGEVALPAEEHEVDTYA